ncbi:MAG: hypothetical protein QHI38_10055 [Armatimonadota bacterium]|nr:hypothetical protein [Armatimonadota bacterium]
MRTFRVRFSLVSSLGTPFLADTLFGHICWAIRYLEGETALTSFLQGYCNGRTPLLVSDGMPVIGDHFYVPRPLFPVGPSQLRELSDRLGLDPKNRTDQRLLASACKAVEEKRWVEYRSLIDIAAPLNAVRLLEKCLILQLCPGSMAERDASQCSCTDWRQCPALDTGYPGTVSCSYSYPESVLLPTMHNVINRVRTASVNLYMRKDVVPFYDIYFLASIDEELFSADRLSACLDYLERVGYGRDKSCGCGAIKNTIVEEWSPQQTQNVNGFLNLSSAYVPEAQKLPPGFYQIHVKRGKLGEEYAISYSPWKRPVLMIRAGSVFRADPHVPHGMLVRNVHYQLPDVVQYGYAYPLGVELDEKAV